MQENANLCKKSRGFLLKCEPIDLAIVLFENYCARFCQMFKLYAVCHFGSRKHLNTKHPIKRLFFYLRTGEGIDSSLESTNSKRRSNKRLQLGFYCSSTCEIKLNDKTNIIEQNPIYLVDRASK